MSSFLGAHRGIRQTEVPHPLSLPSEPALSGAEGE
jgi:hypothetical protein